jgi:glycosyltransferase involved in cell wall biosynthesis
VIKRRRVLLLITNLGKGGAQRVFYDHALAFREKFFVEEVVFDRKEDQRVYDSSLPLHDLRTDDFFSKFWAIGRLVSRALALRRLVRKGRFDVVISHMDGANWVNVLSFSTAKKILVVHGTVLRDQRFAKFFQWFRVKFIFPILYNRANRTVAVSLGIERELSGKCGVRNVSTIQNFFALEDIRKMAAMRVEQKVACVFGGPGVLITSGRLSEQKKQSHLIDALKILLTKRLSVKLIILGDGELRDCLLRKCDELKLRTYDVWSPNLECTEDFDVYFFGYVNNPFKYLARSTLFLFPSGWEGFPLALCEAMISGVAVLSADCPTGPREILAPTSDRKSFDLREVEVAQNGILLPMIEGANDLMAWVTAIEKLLGDAELRQNLVEHGFSAMEALSRDVIVLRWEGLIDDLCDVS